MMPRVRDFLLFFLFLIPVLLISGESMTDTKSEHDKNIISFFHFNEGVAVDSMGRATISLGPSAKIVDEGRLGGAIFLSPRGAETEPKTVVKIPEGKLLSESFSIDFWVKIVSKSPVLGRPMYFLSTPNLYFRYSVDRQTLQFGIQTSNGWVGVEAPKSEVNVVPDRWFHLMGTSDGTEIRFYVDSKLQARASISNPRPLGDFVIGSCGWSNRTTEEMEGLIDELRFSILPVGPSIESNSPVADKKVEKTTPSEPIAKTGNQDTPFVCIPKTFEKPSIDGYPFGKVWEKAVWVGNPVYLNQKEITDKLRMYIGILWDDEALYVGFRNYLTRPPLTVTTSGGDDGLERDDAVEVTLQIPEFKIPPNIRDRDRDKPVQFKLNCEGLRDDAIGFDFSWNAKWEGAVRKRGNEWYATFRIPFSNFGVNPKIGDRWGANFAGFLVGYDYRGFLWSPVATGHHHTGPFGTIEFGGPDTPGNSIGDIKVELSSIKVAGTLASTGIARMVLLPASESEGKNTMLGNVIAIFDEDSKHAVAQSITKIDTPGIWTLSVDKVPSGSYIAKIILIDSNGRLLNMDIKPVRITRSVEVDILKYPVAGSASAKVSVYNMGKPWVSPEYIELKVMDPSGKIIHTIKEKAPSKLGTPVIIPMGKLKNEEIYTVDVKAISADGADMICDTVKFSLPPRPHWADTDAGKLNGKILKPWIPIEIQNTALSCWGRTYDIGNSLLPVSIISSGHKILAEQIRIVVGSRHKENILTTATYPPKISISNTGDIATFKTRGESDICNLDINGSMEFDGFMLFNLSVKPKMEVDRFIIEIPIDNELARYMEPLPGGNPREPVGKIPEQGISMGPVNTLWICNEYAGLFFGCDSTQYWKAPQNKAIEIVRDGRYTLLRLNFYLAETGFTEERSYRFYLQATPIRPYNPDRYEKQQVIHGLQWGQNVTPLEDDTVRSLSTGNIFSEPEGVFEIIVRNKNNLKAITEIENWDHWCMDEKILSITSKDGQINLLYSKLHGGLIILETPWGNLGLKNNALWMPDETHRLVFTWGNKLRFYVDGKLQGELDVRGLPLSNATINLGSVSARYDLLCLRIRKKVEPETFGEINTIQKTDDTLLFVEGPINLRSTARTVLTKAKEMGADIGIFFEHWCHIQNGGRSKYEPALKNFIEDAHRIGLKVILYFGFEIADVPDHKDIIDECKSLINQSPNYYAPQKQNTWWVSYGSPYQEYLLYNMKRLRDEIGIDGVYLDGTLGLGLSDNPAFGCGYMDEQGKRIPTIPTLRIREFAKRMNNLFLQEHDGFIMAHLGMVPPTMGFASIIYLGEHVGFLNVPWKSVMDIIPLDVAKAKYSGLNTGVPMELCIQNMWPHLRSIRPSWFERASAWADLHRITINVLLENPMANEGLKELDKNSKFAEFGVDKAEWIPYWEIDKRNICSSDNIKMSIHRRDDGAMLCVVANISGEDISGVINFSAWEKITPPKDVVCKEIFTGKEVKMEGNKVYVNIPAYERIILKIEK